MKRCSLVIILLFAAVAAIAQNNDVEFLEPINYLYRDGPNEMKIARNGKLLNPNDYKIDVENGTYTKNDSCIWVDIHTGGWPSLIIREKNDSIIGRQKFRIMPMQTFTCLLNGFFRAYSIDKSVLMKMITASLPPLGKTKAPFGIST